MSVYEYTRDHGFKGTCAARIFVGSSNCSVFIEGRNDIYEFDAETLEDAIKLVERCGFKPLVEER